MRGKKKSDIRGVDGDYEAHTAANKNRFHGGGGAEKRRCWSPAFAERTFPGRMKKLMVNYA